MHLVKQSKLVQVLRIKPFFLLWFAQIVSQISLNMTTFVLGIGTYTATKTNTSVSILYLMVGLPALLGIVSGVFVDRYNKRTFLLITGFLRTLIAIFILVFSKNVWVSYVGIGMLSLTTQFFLPALAALIPSLVTSELMISANALYILTFYVSMIGGYVVGGPVLSLFGEVTLLKILALCFGLSWISVYFLPKKTNISNVQRSYSSMFKEMSEVISYIKHTPYVLYALLLLAMSQAIIAILSILGPGFADQVLNIKLTDASLIILAPAALGLILGTGVIGTLNSRWRKRDLILFGILLSGLTLCTAAGFFWLINNSNSIASGTVGHWWIMLFSLLTFFLLGFANSLIDVSCNTVVQERTHEHIRGRVLGVLSSLIAGASVVPVLVTAMLADIIGLTPILAVLGILLIIVYIVSIKRQELYYFERSKS